MTQDPASQTPADEPTPDACASEHTADSCACPICATLQSCKDSDFARHLRGMGKEGLLAARCILDWCINQADTLKSKPEKK